MDVETSYGYLSHNLLLDVSHPRHASLTCRTCWLCAVGSTFVISALVLLATIRDSTMDGTRLFFQNGSIQRAAKLASGNDRSAQPLNQVAIPGQAESWDLRPRLAVRGEASRKAVADMARLQVVVRTKQNTVAEAQSFVQERMVKIEAFLNELGLVSGKERRTGAYDLHPVWSQRPREAPDNWTSQILGYELEHRTVIETKHLELVGELLAKCAEHGADEVNLDGFFLSQQARAAFRSELLAEAVKNAREEASTTAVAAGTALGPISRIEIESPMLESHLATRRQHKMAVGFAEIGGAPSIEAGEIEVRAGVHIVWLLGADGTGGPSVVPRSQLSYRRDNAPEDAMQI
eukprot:gnl/TRDRNA2_/TRDRNA2_41147_c0_seq1.p1 gnl/TRDRNA2_/TRDRNA2_41147_c0~~gnl/TRDRNA2_/TRDRNA2_41147_c0_seq1.p1  ORF type:complete len:348 (+),score=59.08 gnl/TRDRNA2_/TRDRNA2_41147_c0_seq1:75-1118(+)